jgi:hypothetical protein
VQLITKFGLALVALGIAIFAAWSIWTKTRNLVPVDAAVSLAAGQTVTSQFKLNFDGLYLVEIAAGPAIPADTLRCLMGVQADATQCKDVAPAIGADWVLTSAGQDVRRGSSLNLHSSQALTGGLARVIGEFHGKAGQEYTLQTTFNMDGGSLAAAHPRLKVAIASIAYTDLQSASILVLSATSICVLFGLILLSIAYCTKCSRALQAAR